MSHRPALVKGASKEEVAAATVQRVVALAADELPSPMVGAAARDKDRIYVPDAYADERFERSFDQVRGHRLCAFKLTACTLLTATASTPSSSPCAAVATTTVPLGGRCPTSSTWPPWPPAPPWPPLPPARPPEPAPPVSTRGREPRAFARSAQIHRQVRVRCRVFVAAISEI